MPSDGSIIPQTFIVSSSHPSTHRIGVDEDEIFKLLETFRVAGTIESDSLVPCSLLYDARGLSEINPFLIGNRFYSCSILACWKATKVFIPKPSILTVVSRRFRPVAPNLTFLKLTVVP